MLTPRLTLWISVGLAAIASVAGANSAVEPESRLDLRKWVERFEEINAEVGEKQPRLVFIGDSITDFWYISGKDVWQAEYERYNAANLGIAADRTEQVLWRLQNGNLEGISPVIAVILIGTNNIETNSPAEIVEGVLAVVNEVRTRTPDTRILLHAIFPRGDLPPELEQNLSEANALLAATPLDERTTFMDIGSVFLDESGHVPREVMWDRLHLTKEGYRRWAEAIRAEIESVLER